MVARTARKYRPPSPHIRKTLTPKKLKTPVEVKKMVIPSYQQPIIFAVKPSEVTLEKLAKKGRSKAIHSAPAPQVPNLDFDGVGVLAMGEELLRQATLFNGKPRENTRTVSNTVTVENTITKLYKDDGTVDVLEGKHEFPDELPDGVSRTAIIETIDTETLTEEVAIMIKEQTFEEACKEAGLEPVDNSPIPGMPVGSMIMAAVMGAGVASYPMIEKGVSGMGIAKAVGAGLVSAGLELLIESKVNAVSNNTAARYTCASVVGSAIGGGVIGIEKVLENRRNTPTPISYPISEQPITDE